jgi:Protein of unknown function (DUF3828)
MKRLLFFLVATLMLLPSCARAQNVDQARTFISGIYARYGHKNASDWPDTSGPGAAKLFSPSLLQLIRRDQRRTPKGDVGALDFDPICSCQDADGLKLASLDVKMGAPATAIAIAMLHFPDAPDGIRVQLTLKWFASGWRIDEISTNDVPSLRKLLGA